MSELARSLGRSNSDITTIWVRTMAQQATPLQPQANDETEQDVWPCHFYDHRPEPSNPLRCIHADRATQLRYFENMSRAFATKATAFARVLHRAADYADPPLDGIWGRVELPEVVSGRRVDALQK
ncbi:MAG: hypothetical protein INR71_13510, partial [Terriglobus roseus]|nr:hypothetical protein [Terriglobus roseus]